MAFSLSSVIGGSIGDLFTKVVGAFKLPPEKAAEMEMAKEQHQADLAQLQLSMEEKLQEQVSHEVDTAASNIHAEAMTGDKFTSRARPMFLYLCYVILGWNYIFLPLIQYIGHKPPMPIALPDSLLWLFGSGYLGYTGARSWDKFTFSNNATGAK